MEEEECWIISDWMVDIANLTLLNTGYFCVPIPIHEICSGTQLSYLETVWSLWVLIFRYFRWNQSNVYSRANFASLFKQRPFSSDVL